MIHINHKVFFDGFRKHFNSDIKQTTVESLDAILDVFEQSKETIRVHEKLAYMLATVRHEVGANMTPIIENLNYTSIKRIRAVWPSRFPTDSSAKPYVRNPERLGNKVYGGRMGNGLFDGYKFRGRGIGAQLTGHDNYAKFSKLLDMDMVHQPGLAMIPEVGAQILYRGMIDGLFTGRKLSGFINGATVDYVNARRTVNGDVERNGARVAEDAKLFEIIFKNCLTL